jgi:multiple sugar transport system substrate-binding protein
MMECPDVMEELFRRFEERYNVNLEVETITFSDLQKKIVLAGEAGELPDVIQHAAYLDIPLFAEKGWLEPLNAYIEKEDAGKFLDGWFDWAHVRYEGKIYGLQSHSGITGLYWNKTAFARAGIASPPRTWDELVETAQKLTDPPRQYGLGLNGNDPEIMFCNSPFVYQNGGRVGRVKGKIRINSPESVEAIEFLLDLINKYKVVPAFTTSGYREVRDAFGSGRVAMIPDAGWTVPIIRAFEPKFEWGIATLPKGKTTGAAISGWDATYSMARSTRNKDLAWEFIKHMTSYESNFLWMVKYPYFPARKDVAARKEIKENPLRAALIKQGSLPNVYNIYAELPPQTMEAIEIFKVELHSAVLGKKTAKVAMDAVVEKWERLYEEWERLYGPYSGVYD